MVTTFPRVLAEFGEKILFSSHDEVQQREQTRREQYGLFTWNGVSTGGVDQHTHFFSTSLVFSSTTNQICFQILLLRHFLSIVVMR